MIDHELPAHNYCVVIDSRGAIVWDGPVSAPDPSFGVGYVYGFGVDKYDAYWNAVIHNDQTETPKHGPT